MAHIWVVVFGIALLALLFVIKPIYPLAGTALLLAYLISPMVDGIQQHLFRGRRRGLAAALVLILFLVLLILFFLWLIPPLLAQGAQAIIFLFDLLERFLTEPLVIFNQPITNSAGETIVIEKWLQQMAETGELRPILAQWQQRLGLGFSTVSRLTFGTVRLVESTAQGIIGLLISALLFVFVVFYLLHDGRNLRGAVVGAAPDGYQEDVMRLLHDLGHVWNNYLRGQIILALIMGSSMWLIAVVLGLPNPLIFALIAGLMEFVPNIGPALALAPPTITALFVTSSTLPELSGLPIALMVIGLWFIMQQLEAVVLVPTIVGGSLRLHPVVMILAVVWGASVGGILGVILAAPIVASVRILGQYVYGRLTNRPSFMPMPTPQPTMGERLRKLRGRFPKARTEQS